MQWQFEQSAAVVEALLVCVSKEDPTITPERIREAGQRLFNYRAIENRDADLWNRTQQLDLRRDRLELAKQRLEESVKKRKEKLGSSRAKPRRGAGIQSETLEQIERELKLM
jgi:hypothetical protein